MRVLVCQTPKLTYVQAIELLQRETAESVCDLALLPEMAMEHPPQCTGQGELSFENVALMMLSRFARQHRIYIVLGSIEERTPFAKIYDTCIVIDRQGEFLLQYRKQSVSSPAKTAGTEPGIFETEFGPIGLLLGAEAEEEQRWAPLVARRPCLLLNPTREPAKMDPVLAKAHPELQVAAWHQGFSRLERITDLHMRSYSCPFVRADAPLQEGGAGISILVEQHRSVLAPCWGSVFFIVETAHPSELVSRRLPGWHQLTIDERIEAAQHDKEVLMQEEVVRGPRYLVWTFRLPQAQLLAIKREGAHWAVACQESSPGIDNTDRCWLMPLTSHGGRALYAVATRRGGLTLWDVRQKRDVFTCNLGASASVTAGGGFSKIATLSLSLAPGAVVTAVGPWHSRSQFILASAAPAGVTLRVFDESTPMRGTLVQRGSLPWNLWPCADFLTGLPLPGPYPEDKGERYQPEPGQYGEPPPDVVRPVVRAVYPFDHFMAIAVLEGPGSTRVPMGLLIDLESGTTEPLDIYGAGPVEPEEEDEQADEQLSPRRQDEEEEVKRPTGLDLLVGCHFIEQRFQERGPKQQRALVCLYRSNRICLVTCSDWMLHEQLLLEEMASARQRNDVPVACAVLPNVHSGTYHIVVSYASMVIRWWQASLSQCRLQSHVLLPTISTHVAVLEWPSAAPPEKPAAASAAPPAPGPAAAPAAAPQRGAAGRRAQGKAGTATRLPPLVPPAFNAPIAVPGRSVRQSAVSLFTPAASTPAPSSSGQPSAMPAPRARSLLPMPAQPLDVRSGSTMRGRSQRDSVMTRASFTTATEETRTPPSSFMEYAYHAASILVVAFEASGAMPIFLAHGGRMVRAFTCLDHFVYRDTCVDQLWCLDRSIAVQLSNGDVRHFEFLVEGEVINLVDMPIERP